MTRLFAALAAACFLVLIPARAEPAPLTYCAADQTYRVACTGAVQRTGGARRAPPIDANGNRAARVVAHPAGCPRRLFCGCGVSVRVFGKPVRSLYFSRNYLQFPRAAPAAGMVAYRSRRGGGHVAYIERYLGNGMADLYDPNSGRGRTHRHIRSIAGWIVVNPRAQVAGL